MKDERPADYGRTETGLYLPMMMKLDKERSRGLTEVDEYRLGIARAQNHLLSLPFPKVPHCTVRPLQ